MWCLRTKLRAFHAASGDRYGRPRLWKDLQEDGEAVSEKRVGRLMRAEGIQGNVAEAVHTRRPMSEHGDPIAAECARPRVHGGGARISGGSATRPSSSLASSGKLYLAAILDLYSRFVVGWAISAVNDRRLTLKALEMAVQRRCPEPGLLHHSDRGCTYTCEDYQTVPRSRAALRAA